VAQSFSMGAVSLGVGVAEVTSERAKALKLKEERGVEITSVSDDSPPRRRSEGRRRGSGVQRQRIEGTQQFRAHGAGDARWPANASAG